MRARAAVIVAALTLGGCEDEPKKTAPTAAVPPAMPEPLPLAPAAPMLGPLGHDGPVLPKTALKIYRAEICYFGSFGLLLARDAYWESLNGLMPGPGRVPNFGEYPGQQKRKLPGSQIVEPLPFDRHVRSCTSAKAVKEAAFAKLDPALERYEKYSQALLRTIDDARRYYGRGEQLKDDYKKGLELHETLSEQLGDLDDEVAAYEKAELSWRPTAEMPEDGLDDAGKKARKVVADARALALAALAPVRDAAAIEAAAKKVDAGRDALAALADKDPDAMPPGGPFAQMLVPRLEKLAVAAREAAAASGKLSRVQKYVVANAMAEVLEGEQIAWSRLIRPEDDRMALPLMRPPKRDAGAAKKK
jgi:uncharacterized protein DUF3829